MTAERVRQTPKQMIEDVDGSPYIVQDGMLNDLPMLQGLNVGRSLSFSQLEEGEMRTALNRKVNRERVLGRRRLLGRLWGIFFVGVVSVAWSRACPAGAGEMRQEDFAALDAKAKSIFEENCVAFGCHISAGEPPHGLILEPKFLYEKTINVASREVPEWKRIAPGDPDNSYLVRKVRGAPGIKGQRMPAFRDPLKPEEIQTIVRWVTALKDHPNLWPSPEQEKAAAEAAPSRPAFFGTRIFNLPTAEMLPAKTVEFRIHHRYRGAIKEGLKNNFGMDFGGVVTVSLGYTLLEHFSATLSRNITSAVDATEGHLKWQALQQKGNGSPVSVAVVGGLSFLSETEFAREPENKFRVYGQLALSRRFGKSVSLLAVPTYATKTDYSAKRTPKIASDEGSLAIGTAGAIYLLPDLALTAEWIPPVSGFAKKAVPAWSVGIARRIGGHVFQIFLTNSIATNADQYITGSEYNRVQGVLDEKGRRDIRPKLAFNISRVFWFGRH